MKRSPGLFRRAVDEHLKAQLPGDTEHPVTHIVVEYLAEGRTEVPDTCYGYRKLEFQKNGVVWRLYHGWDWGDDDACTVGKGVPKKHVTTDIPKAWINDMLKFEYKSHEQMTWPHNGIYSVLFAPPRGPKKGKKNPLQIEDSPVALSAPELQTNQEDPPEND